jgi:WD40 repeat protein
MSHLLNYRVNMYLILGYILKYRFAHEEILSNLKELYDDHYKNLENEKLKLDGIDQKNIKNNILIKNDIKNDIKKYKCEKTIEAHKDFIFRVIELKNGKLCTCSQDKKIKIWNGEECEIIIDDHIGPVITIFQLKDERIISAGFDKNIKLFNLNGKCEKTIEKVLI